MNCDNYPVNTVMLRVTHSDIPRLLREMNLSQIDLYNIILLDELTADLTVARSAFAKFQYLAKKRNARLQIRSQKGVYWKLLSFWHRPILLFSLLLILGATWMMPSRVFFFTVEGNQTLSSMEILEAAQVCGISFGVKRDTIRSEKMKNKLLEQLPQLQWAGINTYGCRAVISVTERQEIQKTENGYGVSSIIAGCDGIICYLTVAEGNALCDVGQAVREGELLVSGYTDCGRTIRAVEAEAEIYAQTARKLEVVIPGNRIQKGELLATEHKYSVLIGKKRINLCKDSGNLGVTCDKMYQEYYVTLPGGFQLPLALCVEQRSYYDCSALPAASQSLEAIAKKCAEDYLLRQMISGQIISEKTVVEHQGTACRLSGQYACLEMIGRKDDEEISIHYGKSN